MPESLFPQLFGLIHNYLREPGAGTQRDHTEMQAEHRDYSQFCRDSERHV